MATKVEPSEVVEVPVEVAAVPVADHQQVPSAEDSLNADQK
jgi:hypothetical protein